MEYLREAELLRLLPPALQHGLLHGDPAPETLAAVLAHLRQIRSALLPGIPIPVAHHLQYELTPFGANQYSGSLLGVEVTGLTHFLNQKMGSGRSGSEEASRIVSHTLKILVQTIERWGGWVLQSSGETITAFFNAATLGPPHPDLAATAALALREHADELIHPTATQSFGLRQALHSGRLFLAEVGDERQRLLLSTGQALNQAIKLLASAAPGEILLSSEARQALPDGQVEARGSNEYQLVGLSPLPDEPTLPAEPSSPAIPDEAQISALVRQIDYLASYLPLPIKHYTSPMEQLAGEFRPVTVLYAHFYAFHRLLMLLAIPALVENDRSLLGDVLHLYYNQIQAAIHDHGGSINTIEMAAFGNSLLAVFGAPRAHEDDPRRALYAARALHQASTQAQKAIVELVQRWIKEHPAQRGLHNVLSLPLPQRIGIASGPVFAGMIGGPERQEYRLLGTTVSLAARLQTLARDGETLVAGLTRRMVPRSMRMVPMEPLVDEGSGPIPVFGLPREPVAESEQLVAAQGRFIGRSEELAQLEALAMATLQTTATGQVVALSGEQGIGKTRLAEVLLSRVRTLLPATIMVRANSQSEDINEPYCLISRMLPALLNNTGSKTLLPERLKALLPDWERFLPLLYPLLDLPVQENEAITSLPLEQQSERTIELIVALCKAVAQERPLLLLIDNMHWIDHSSQQALVRLAQECSDVPLLLLLLYRQGIVEPWNELPWTTSLVLEPLASDDQQALVRDLLESDELPAALIATLSRSGGSPLFLTELVQYLLDAGLLQRSAGQWRYQAPDEQAVSARLEQIIFARLDLLASEARRLLEIAAAIGGNVEERLLSILQSAAPLVANHLGELVQQGLLVPMVLEAQTSYSFRHPLVREVTYSSMLFARRRLLHREIATTLEQLYPQEETRPRARLARQWQSAEEHAQAMPYFLAAANDAQARYANAEALALFTQAHTSASQIGNKSQQASIQRAMGDIQALTGAYNEAREAYQASLALLADDDALVEVAALERRIGVTYEHQGEHEQALQWLFQAAARLKRSESTASIHERARIFSEIGWVHFRRGAPETALPQLEAALELFQQVDDATDIARVFNRLGGVAWQRGELIIAQRYVEQSLRASERSGHLLGQAEALGNLSNLAESQGQREDALRYSQRAVALINEGWSYYHIEDYGAARDRTARAAEIALAVRDNYHAVLAHLNLGRICTEQGDWEGAAQALATGIKLADGSDIPYEQLDLLTAMADLVLRQGNLGQARQYAVQAHLLASRLEPMSNERAGLQRLEGKLAMAAGRHDLAAQLLRASADRFRQLQNPSEAERTLKLLRLHS
jgi:class 3 adenylate cyclase/tetratricopeptide (TPR) repeat protein